MNMTRLEQIRRTWIGDNHQGLAITGNEPYRMIKELIDHVADTLSDPSRFPKERSKNESLKAQQTLQGVN